MSFIFRSKNSFNFFFFLQDFDFMKKFLKGHCQFGDRCKFLHSGVPGVILKQQFAGDSASGTNPRK